jgi:uncharacterized protein
MRALAARLAGAVSTWPDRRGWARALFEAGWSLPLILLLGWAGGLFDPGWTDDPALLARLALIAIIAPAIGEELLFRAALLPAKDEPMHPARGALAIGLFVLWHPLQIIPFGRHWAEIVLDPWFLACVAVLGLALTRLYRATGSIWPGVLLHWLAVVGWKAFLGGPSPWVGA